MQSESTFPPNVRYETVPGDKYVSAHANTVSVLEGEAVVLLKVYDYSTRKFSD